MGGELVAHLAYTAERSRTATLGALGVIGLRSLIACILGRLGCQTVQL
jgi:hypothetical protein